MLIYTYRRSNSHSELSDSKTFCLIQPAMNVYKILTSCDVDSQRLAAVKAVRCRRLWIGQTSTQSAACTTRTAPLQPGRVATEKKQCKVFNTIQCTNFYSGKIRRKMKQWRFKKIWRSQIRFKFHGDENNMALRGVRQFKKIRLGSLQYLWT